MQHHLDVGAAAPGLAAAAIGQKGEGPASTTRQTPQFTNQTQHPNDTEIGAVCLDRTAARKRWVNVQAELLLAGFRAALIDGDDGRPLLVVSRWALTRSFNVLHEAEAWLARVRGQA